MSLDLSRIAHLLIDLDGVLYRGNDALPGASKFITFLRDRGITFRLVTNNATLTPQEYVRKLAGMGIDVTPQEVFTSALATALYLQHSGEEHASAFVIGEEGLLSALDGIGIRRTERNPDWVITGLDRALTYEKLKIAALALGTGARFLASNPDKSLPTEVGIVPGAGAIQAALVATTGVEPIVVGKPEPLMLQLAIDDLHSTVDDTAMLGDRLDTDIQGAVAVGIRSIMVLTGVSTREDLAGSPVQPDLVVDDLTRLMEQWPSR